MANLRTWVAASTIAAASSVVLVAPADSKVKPQSAVLNNSVHDHAFDRVVLEADGCKLTVKLWFTAPDTAYQDRAKMRNSYLFRAKVKFDDKNVLTDLFKTSKPGRKLYTFVHDTSADGCWAKPGPKMRMVDVNGCRGRRCEVPSFD